METEGFLLVAAPPDSAAERLVREAHERLPAPLPLRRLPDGPPEERARLLRQATLVIMAHSDDDTARQAMAAGATLVTVPGLGDFARPDENCRMAPAMPGLLALAVAQLLADPYERRRLGENGRAQAGAT